METTAGNLAKPKPKHRLSGQARFKMGLTGIGLPTIALFFSANGAIVARPHWQSGEASQYIAMLLGWPGFAAFLPLVFFSMAALMVWLWRDRMIQHFIVRLGLSTGVVLSIQFIVLLILAEPEVTWFLLAAAAVFSFGQAVVLFGLGYAFRNARRFSIRYLLVITAVVAIVISFIKANGGGIEFLQALVGIPMVGALASPVLSVVTMVRAAAMACEAGQSRWSKMSVLAVILGWLGWVACFVVAWRIAVEVMLFQYSLLPATRPGCYVASAAAHGHPRLVRSQWVAGISMPVNNQLRRLKFLEFAVKAASPRLHCHARIMYDRFGPKLAAQCRRSRWFSDVAFLFLLLPEMVAVTIQVLFRFRANQVNSLYW